MRFIRRRWFAASVASLAGLAPAGCWPKNVAETGNAPGTSAPAPAAPVAIGPPLYKQAPLVKLETTTPLPAPVVINPAIIQYDLKVQIPAAEDGIIELVATPVTGPVDPNDPLIVYHPRDTGKRQPYRRLRENDKVVAGQTLVRLDEQLIARQIDTAEKMIEASGRGIDEDKKALRAYEKLEDLQKDAEKKGFGALQSVLEMTASVARLTSSLVANEKEKAKAEGEMLQGQTQLARYWCRSPVNGHVTKLLKSPGEFARAGDTILEVQSTDRVRVEGKLPVEYGNLLKKDMVAFIEPTVPLGPLPYSNRHLREVTAVAVTGHPGRPLIVSGGADSAALVWDFTATKRSFRLPHPGGVGVHAVAVGSRAGKPAATYFAATGGGDGKVRLWDLTNPDKIAAEPSAVMDETHTNPVTAAAFSADGAYLATAAGREVFIWDVLGKKKKYALPAEFRDAVTSVSFLPQCRLVTDSRDGLIRCWNLGTEGAATVDPVLDHRSGVVDELGVSADGSRVLFDRDPGCIEVLSLADGRSLGTVQNYGGARFSELAIFHPDGHSILTAGGDSDARGELQLWDAPAVGGRGSERRRLVTPGRANVTCAAFSPDAAHPFVVVGTGAGGVHVWTPPGPGQKGKRIAGRIESVLPSDARSVQVRVVLENPGEADALPDRGQATIVIDPHTVQEAAQRVTVAPAPRPVLPAGGIVAAKAEVIPAGAADDGQADVLRPIHAQPLPTAPLHDAPVTMPPVTQPPAPASEMPVGPRASHYPPRTSIPLPRGGK